MKKMAILLLILSFCRPSNSMNKNPNNVDLSPWNSPRGMNSTLPQPHAPTSKSVSITPNHPPIYTCARCGVAAYIVCICHTLSKK